MKHITSTALEAGAWRSCANSEELSLHGMGSITHQPSFRPVTRRAILTAVNTCGRDLGLRQGAVIVLDALLSCLPCKGSDGGELPVTPSTLLTVYASNETLCFRAKGLTDRQLRRHVETLEKTGFLVRRDSANGKRFPIMKDGKPIGAFGLDLSPLFARADDLLAHALKRQEQAAELRGLRAQILRLRTTCLGLALDSAATAFIDELRNLVRRASLTLVEARAALARLTAVISGHAAFMAVSDPDAVVMNLATHHSSDADGFAPMPEAPLAASMDQPIATLESDPVITEISADPASDSDEMSASDGQDVRHIEPESDTKKRKPCRELQPRWSDLTEISAFYREPESAQDTAVIAFEFGKMLRISQELLVSAVTKLGLWELLRVEDQIARRVETIQNPDAYLRSVLRA